MFVTAPLDNILLSNGVRAKTNLWYQTDANGEHEVLPLAKLSTWYVGETRDVFGNVHEPEHCVVEVAPATRDKLLFISFQNVANGVYFTNIDMPRTEVPKSLYWRG